MVIETHKLINTIKKMYPVVQFFKDRYFPDGKTYYSEKALIETKRGGRKVAPFVIPVVGGIVQDAEGYRAYEVRAPYIAPKMPITAEELERKAFGESPESDRTPAQRENEIEAEHMDDMRNAIYRRQELMCTEIITTGQILMRHYGSADDAANNRNYKMQILRFYEDEFPNRYLFTKDWNSMSAAEKIQELYRIALILKKRGVNATDIVMTGDVSMKLMTDKEFLDFYDKLHVNTGVINQEKLPNGVTCNGDINVNGVIFKLFTYEEVYEDLDGTVKEFLPKGTIAFLHPAMGTTVYAQVSFVKGSSFVSYAERIVPRVVASENDNIVEVQMFSRPVPYPLDWEGWLVANIYDPVAENQDDEDADAPSVQNSDELIEEGIALKTAEEIQAMSKKADVIAYAESIGLSGLTDKSSLDELKADVLNYQDETFGD
ncbi:MAG: major capsid protein [Candidatus Gastranaerophilales bacterium]|nr:major capsid protein [Candidatus Gastranaerophilales bacterium]